VLIQAPPSLRRDRTDFVESHEPTLASWGLVSAGAALALLLTFVARNLFIFRIPIREDDDFATYSVLVERATHFQLLVGNYSRAGFYHPGPALLYIAAAGQVLFHDWLHVVPAQYNGQLIGLWVLAAVCLGLSIGIIYRHARSLLLSGALLAVAAWWFGAHTQIASGWFPYVYIAPFLLFATAGISVAVGSVEDLPAFVLGGGLLVHGHIAFLFFVGIGALVVAGCLVFACRTGRARLRKRPLVVAAVLAGLFVLPLALDVALHYPGQWPAYLSYVRTPTHHHAITAALQFATKYWFASPLMWAVFIGALAGSVVLVLLRPRLPGRRMVLGLLGGVAVLSVLFVYYAQHGIDHLHLTAPNPVYTGYFYMTVPLLLLFAAIVAIWQWLAVGMGQRGWPRWTKPVSGWLGGGVVAAAFVIAAVLAPGFANTYRGNAGLPHMVAATYRIAHRWFPGPLILIPHHDWVSLAGFVIQADRTGISSCEARARVPNVYTVQDELYCSAVQQTRTPWRLLIVPAGTRVSQARLVFRDGRDAVFLRKVDGPFANPLKPPSGRARSS
jgi:MFS family permease